MATGPAERYPATMGRPRGNLPGDVVLIHFQDRPATFARIEDVRPHGRPGWFLCDLLVLSIPPQPVTWILEREQIDGTSFTMGGQPVRLERLPDAGSLHVEMRARESAGDSGASCEPGVEAAEGQGQGVAAEPDSRPPTSTGRGGNVVRLVPRR